MKAILVIAGAGLVLGIAELAHLQLLASLWIPLAMLLFVVGFPLFAVAGRSSLFWGLFDLPLSPRRRLPIRHYFVTLSAFAVAGSALCVIHLIVICGPRRFAIPPPHLWHGLHWLSAFLKLAVGLPQWHLNALLAEVMVLSAYFAAFAVVTSWTQTRSAKPPEERRPLGMMIGGVVAALVTGCAAVWVVAQIASSHLFQWVAAQSEIYFRWLGPGYQSHWVDHLSAFVASVFAFLLYAGLGWYGRWALGKTSTVAALIGPLMVILVLGWIGSGTEFFLGRWHIPLLLVVAVLGWLNSRLPWSDHVYELLDRNKSAVASPYTVLRAGDKSCAIVVASAGGGIQAAAWTAKVLEGLHTSLGKEFDRALCLISSISGGSLGNACFVDWLHRGARVDETGPFDAASASSLDEVSWGLAWPDLLRLLLPWPIKIDRAHAMERAWIGNVGSKTVGAALSDWNLPTERGELPAVVMNSTMVEVGGPLLLGTSNVTWAAGRTSSCWWDGDRLHVSDGRKLDVPVVRAARLSATFPYVTPAARPEKADHQPHMMDGGFYDNYGMATLTEWLDQALTEQEKKSVPGSEPVKRILILQINGFPPAEFEPPKPSKHPGGWVSQLIYPVEILVHVRTAGQVSHRDMELGLLTEKWQPHGIAIETANFELEREDAPLSWHLMPKQKSEISDAWTRSEKVRAAQEQVRKFLKACPPQVSGGPKAPLAGSVATEAGASV